jgi:N-methylhydantoinase B
LRANTRLPDSLWGDLNAQLAALDLGVTRLHALLVDYEPSAVLKAFAALRRRALLLMREHIQALPSGMYTFDDMLDNDGVVDEPLRIALDLRIDGERLSLDFSRSSAQCAGPVNISRATAVAACYVALKHVFPDVPANAGVLDAWSSSSQTVW